jgi:hypothetical protein
LVSRVERATASLTDRNDSRIIIRNRQTAIEATVKSDRTGLRRALRVM